MARNGSGTFTLLNTVAPPGQVNNPTNINATMADIASGLTDSINKDGTKPLAANLPMAGFKITGSGVGSATTDLGRIDQVQSGVVAHATTVGGTVDAITLAFTPTLASLPSKTKFRWTSAGVNTLTNPTITADGFGPYTVKKGALAALVAGDLGASGQINEGVFDGTQILLVSSVAAAAFTGGALTTSTNMSGKDFREAKGAAVASAGTTDIWTPADGNYVHITGTTTITSLGTAHQAGEERTVIFDGILTLTHNATTLILPGAANITTAANDRMIVRADTTANMIVVDYMPASGKPVGGITSRNLLATLTTTSGANQSATGLTPASYRYYEIEVNAVSSTNGGGSIFHIATSGNNGANYGTPVSIGTTASAADTFSGFFILSGINVPLQGGPVIYGGSAPAGTGTGVAVAPTIVPKNATGATGAVNALQFDTGTGTLDAGTILVYGVL